MLILCDDAQEWGRKGISELYINKSIEYDYDGLNIDLTDNVVKVSFGEKYKNIDKEEDVKTIISRFIDISRDYNEIFRDGLDTAKRDFCFKKNTDVDFRTGNNKVAISMSLVISNEASSKIIISLSSTNQHCHKYKQIVGLVKEIFHSKTEVQNGRWEFELGNL